VINIATQKKVIKKKTRVCRHDREPSFNETFRFSLSPAGHSLQVIVLYILIYFSIHIIILVVHSVILCLDTDHVLYNS
jgi:hypothetical protein